MKRRMSEDGLIDMHNAIVDIYKKDLETYKKALELACEAIVDRNCTGGIACSKNNCELYSPCFNEIEWSEYFLKKARDEE